MFRLLAFAVLISHSALVFAQSFSMSLGAITAVMNSSTPAPAPASSPSSYASPASTAIQPTSTAHVTPTPSTAQVAMIEYSANMTLEDYPWNKNHSLINSSEYNTITRMIATEVDKFFNSTGFMKKKVNNFVLMKYNDKVMAMFTIIASPLGERVKYKDPILQWNEEVEKKGKIGELNVGKKSTKLKEEIQSGTTVEGWTTKAGECGSNCPLGPVPQERECSGSDCGKVLTTRWVTCERAGCNAGKNLMSSVPLLIAVLMMKLLD